MTRPLELTIHPRLEDTNLNADEIHQGRWTTLRLIREKRFTDAELAAEYHQAVNEANHRLAGARRAGKTHAVHIANTLLRFATHPHHTEQDH